MSKKNITTITLAEAMKKKGKTRKDVPPGPSLPANFWKNAKVVYPEAPKVPTTIRFDEDVLTWFKAQGRGYQTRMNAVLRSYYEAHHKEPATK